MPKNNSKITHKKLLKEEEELELGLLKSYRIDEKMERDMNRSKEKIMLLLPA